MLPSSAQEWLMLALGVLVGYYIVKHFAATGAVA